MPMRPGLFNVFRLEMSRERSGAAGCIRPTFFLTLPAQARPTPPQSMFYGVQHGTIHRFAWNAARTPFQL